MCPKEDLGVLVVALVVLSVRGINQRNHDESNIYIYVNLCIDCEPKGNSGSIN